MAKMEIKIMILKGCSNMQVKLRNVDHRYKTTRVRNDTLKVEACFIVANL